MKKNISLLLFVVILVGCFSVSSYADLSGRDGAPQIVVTIFPEYDWVMNVLGSNPAGAVVTLLLDRGVDLHSYQPSASDILKVSSCDLFIYVGGESDAWVEDVLKNSTNEKMTVINLLDELGSAVREEELVEGMQHDHEHEDHDAEEEHDHEHDEVEYDEHVWLSLRHAAFLVNRISEALQEMDSDNSKVYRENTASYTAKLNELDSEYQAAVSESSVKTLLFGDRFPFRYMVDDYGLSYYAAFAGCSAETEASFETITFLAQKTDELSLHAVMTIEGPDHRIAETIVRNTHSADQKILTLDSLQSVTKEDIQNGITYLSVMEKNLAVLKEALK